MEKQIPDGTRSSPMQKKFFSLITKRLLLCCLYLTSVMFLVLYGMGHLSHRLLTIPSQRRGPDVELLEEPKIYFLCADFKSPDSWPCLCYYHSSNLPENYTIPKIASIEDVQLVHLLKARCAMTVNALGRLGNLMGEYAVVYALARANNRPAFMVNAMAKELQKYFNLSMPILSENLEKAKGVWSEQHLHYWMEDSYAKLNGTFVMITGYPYSWTYFHHLRQEILREFAFQDDVLEAVRKHLLELRSGRPSVTYVGVHARRSDYLNVFKHKDYLGVIADELFFRNATDYFRSRYPDCIFVVASDDIKWCQENIDNSKKDVYFVGNGNIANPIFDMALLSNCNHSIITIGTFGFWTAYLAGGETVHYTNYSKPGVYYDLVLRPEKLYLPNWIPIAANRSSIL